MPLKAVVYTLQNKGSHNNLPSENYKLKVVHTLQNKGSHNTIAMAAT